MENSQNRPIVSEKECAKDVMRAHKIYIKYPFLRKDYALLKKLPKDAILLDIGCGNGAYLKRASLLRPDLRLWGLDIYSYLEMIEVKELESFIMADCNRPLPLSDESVDFVHCAHVIEHLHNPSLLIGEIYRILKKGGMSYIESPSPMKIFVPPLFLLGTNFYDDPTHIRPYTKESLRRLALQAGFAKENIQVFLARNWFGVLSLPYTLFKFLTTGYGVYLEHILQPFLLWDVGGIFVK